MMKPSIRDWLVTEKGLEAGSTHLPQWLRLGRESRADEGKHRPFIGDERGALCCAVLCFSRHAARLCPTRQRDDGPGCSNVEAVRGQVNKSHSIYTFATRWAMLEEETVKPSLLFEVSRCGAG